MTALIARVRRSSTATAMPGAAGPIRPRSLTRTSRGTIEQLLYEMDTNGVAQALVVCAAIERQRATTSTTSPPPVRLTPAGFHVVADLDCTWSTTYHRPGSADRLRALDDRYELVGFTHYLRERNDGWLLSDEADALFAARRGAQVSSRASPSGPPGRPTSAASPAGTRTCRCSATISGTSAPATTPGSRRWSPPLWCRTST